MYIRVVEHVQAEELSDDPRSDWTPAHGPDGRIAYIAEVEQAMVLHADEDESLASGDFLVWEDGHYRAAKREEIMSNKAGWDLEGPSLFQFVPDE